jgi:hypothetical protein
MAVSFPASLSSLTQAANVQGFKNAAAPKLPLRYPLKSINKNDDYLEIGVIKYVPPGFDFKKDPAGKDTLQLTTGSEKNSNIKADYTIQLPIPANISDTNQVDWGSGDVMNSLAAYGAQSIGGVIQSGDLGKGTIDALKSAGVVGIDVLTKGGGQEAIKDIFTSKLANVFGANTTPSSIRSRAQGSILNPNLELLFSGVNLRSFTFDFDFAPRDARESGIVKEIIRILKQSMAPKTGSSHAGAGLFIESPNAFLLKYKTGSQDHPYLNKFKPCALTNMGVNYTGSGSYATYADKTPVHMKLSLSFTELNPIYNEDYKAIPLSQGVGY